MADRIAFINQGKLLAIGTPAEVRANKDPLLQEFLNANFNPAKVKE